MTRALGITPSPIAVARCDTHHFAFGEPLVRSCAIIRKVSGPAVSFNRAYFAPFLAASSFSRSRAPFKMSIIA